MTKKRDRYAIPKREWERIKRAAARETPEEARRDLERVMQRFKGFLALYKDRPMR